MHEGTHVPEPAQLFISHGVTRQVTSMAATYVDVCPLSLQKVAEKELS